MFANSLDQLTITLDTTLTKELIIEGDAREIINKINTLRKTEGFEIVDRIEIQVDTTQKIKEAFEKYLDLISHEVLAVKVLFESSNGVEMEINGEKAIISLKKV